MPELDQLAIICKLLSVPSRLRLVALLCQQPLCVNALARQLGITAAAVSQHLRVLRQAELVQARKQGYFVHYSINTAQTEAIQKRLAELFAGQQQPGQGLCLPVYNKK